MLVLPKAWIERWQGQDVFKKIAELEETVYKKKEGRSTFRFVLDGKPYFAKLHLGIGWKEIFKNLVQLSEPVIGAENEWRAIQHLKKLGIRTLRLVGYGKCGWNPARIRSFVITEELHPHISLEKLCVSWPSSPPSYELKRALITEVARIARTMHRSGMNHRDLYLCHFLIGVPDGVDYIDPEYVIVYLIDLHRAKIRKRTPRSSRIKDMAALYFSSMDAGLTDRDILRFIRIYGGRSIKASLEYDRAFWGRVEKRGGGLYRKHLRKHPEREGT